MDDVGRRTMRILRWSDMVDDKNWQGSMIGETGHGSDFDIGNQEEFPYYVDSASDSEVARVTLPYKRDR